MVIIRYQQLFIEMFHQKEACGLLKTNEKRQFIVKGTFNADAYLLGAGWEMKKMSMVIIWYQQLFV